ncbi:MAG: hypothetical protein WDO24_20975 [Pseudomonadota bacterium]
MDRIDRQSTLPGWLVIGAAAVLFVAVGAAAARGVRRWRAPGAAGPRRRGRRSPPDWYSESAPSPDGRMAPDRLVDLAEQDSFPASDPPGYRTRRTGGFLH